MAILQPPAGYAWFGAYPGSGNAAPNAGYEANVAGRQLAAYLRYYAFSSGTFPTAADETLMTAGRYGVFSLQNQFGSTYTIKWADVSAGTYDGHLNAIAAAVQAGGNPCFVEYEAEPDDGGKIGGGGSNLGTAAQYVAAFQHVATKLRAGAPGLIAMCWTVSSGSATSAPTYPGDAYVDWMCVDPYDPTLSKGSASATYTPFITWLNTNPLAAAGGAGSGGGHGKPLGIFETGVDDNQADASIAAWLKGGGSYGTGVPVTLAGLSTTWGSTYQAWLWFNSSGTLGATTILTNGTMPLTIAAMKTIGGTSFFNPPSGVVNASGSAAGAATVTAAATAAPPAVYAAAYGPLYGSIPVSSRPVLTVQVDWNNNGLFTDPGGNITRRVLLSRTDLTIAYGRDTAQALSPVSAGTAAFEVNNVSGDYYPDNTGSPLYGNLVPGRGVLIQATQDTTVHNLFNGFLDDYTPLPNAADQSVQFSCLDALAIFQGVLLSTTLYQGIRTGTVIGHILDVLQWPSAARDLDVGATYYRWWWAEGNDALSALQQVLADEGPPAICYVDQNGTFCFRDRHHRLLRAASKSAQATFTNGTSPESGTVATYSQPSQYDAGWKNIINTVIFGSDQRDPAAFSVVWQQSSLGTGTGGQGTVITQNAAGNLVQYIPAGGTVVITAQSSGDPFKWAQTPLAGIDFKQLSGTTTASLSRSSGQSTIITLTDSGGGSWISGLQLRAIPVTVTNTTQTTNTNSTSVAAYGVRGTGGTGSSQPAVTTVSPLVSPQDAAAVAQVLLNDYAQRRPIVTLPFWNRTGYTLTQMLTRDLSDRVTVTDTVTGMNADCFIERIAYDWSQGGLVLQATFSCEKAPTWPWAPFIFDDATYGRFNTGGGFGL